MPFWFQIVAGSFFILLWSYIALAVISIVLNMWVATKYRDPLVELFRGLDVSRTRRPGDVLVQYHTWEGILISISQLEHKMWCGPADARTLINRFLRFNLMYGSGALFGPVVVAVSISNWLRERRSVATQSLALPPIAESSEPFVEEAIAYLEDDEIVEYDEPVTLHPVHYSKPSKVFRVMKVIRLAGILIILGVCGIFYLISLLNR